MKSGAVDQRAAFAAAAAAAAAAADGPARLDEGDAVATKSNVDVYLEQMRSHYTDGKTPPDDLDAILMLLRCSATTASLAYRTTVNDKRKDRTINFPDLENVRSFKDALAYGRAKLEGRVYERQRQQKRPRDDDADAPAPMPPGSGSGAGSGSGSGAGAGAGAGAMMMLANVADAHDALDASPRRRSRSATEAAPGGVRWLAAVAFRESFLRAVDVAKEWVGEAEAALDADADADADADRVRESFLRAVGVARRWVGEAETALAAANVVHRNEFNWR